ncbi:D-3-phosphoglycerate dehydrogenase 2 [Hortaea werneckii]|nr:D-3-phosphoglycerate dehydrogenase 2 [Hortaea werneckii]
MPSPAIGIPDRTNGQADGLNRTVSNSYNDLATSPNASFQSPPGSFGGRLAASAKSLKPFHTQDIKVLLLENVNKTGQDILKKQGYQIEILKSSLPENELIEKIQDVHVIGIRSKTQLTANVLKHAKNLIVIGCFCIGTNQVDLKYAAENGIAVFNSPFSNSRSVAEQMIGEIISLARQIGDRNNELHQGVWNKVSAGCWEVRGKTLGIVGYGHVGSQLSVLAEAMGMRVIYYDVVNLMSLGTSNQVPSLDALLQQADFVTLHVPELPETINMISTKQFEQMKNGSYLLNASRGTVVDIPALIKASQAGKLAGAALDVYPNEPAGNGPKFTNELNTWTEELRNLKNIILTPHIGGSTEEAQAAIGIEVADALVNYVNFGTTAGAVNMPEVTLRSLTIEEPNHVRVIYIHKNIPGVLRRVNEILGDHNVDKQMTDSRGDVAYLMADISNVNISEIQQLYQSLEDLGSRIRTRVLSTLAGWVFGGVTDDEGNGQRLHIFSAARRRLTPHQYRWSSRPAVWQYRRSSMLTGGESGLASPQPVGSSDATRRDSHCFRASGYHWIPRLRSVPEMSAPASTAKSCNPLGRRFAAQLSIDNTALPITKITKLTHRTAWFSPCFLIPILSIVWVAIVGFSARDTSCGAIFFSRALAGLLATRARAIQRETIALEPAPNAALHVDHESNQRKTYQHDESQQHIPQVETGVEKGEEIVSRCTTYDILPAALLTVL